MAPLTTAHVRTLLTPPATPCVSLYMPTHRTEPGRREDADPVQEPGPPGRGAAPAEVPGRPGPGVLRKFDALAADAAFWSDAQDGLAAFAAGDVFAAHRLPRAVPELVVVADSFHIKPLLRVTQSADRFQVLGVTRTEAWLFEGNRYGLPRVADGRGRPDVRRGGRHRGDQAEPGEAHDRGPRPSTGHYLRDGRPRKDTWTWTPRGTSGRSTGR